MSLTSAVVNSIEALTTLNSRLLERLRWYPTVVGFGGYGNPHRVRIMGRVLMGTRADERNWLGERRGWRQYFDAQVPRQPVLVSFGESRRLVHADRGGYIDVELDIAATVPGWHTARLQVVHRGDHASRKGLVRTGKPVGVPIRIVGDQESVGVISDVDDTIMITMVPQRLQAIRYVLLEHATRRQSVKGMAALLKGLQFLGLQLSPEGGYSPLPPVFYLSNGAWNVVPTLRRFLIRLGFPRGTLLLRPWGINAGGLPPRGINHKLAQFERINSLLPHLKWFLVGDDGEHDPEIYRRISQAHPGKVLAVLIRTLSEPAHIALHGTPHPPTNTEELATADVLTIKGKDGHALRLRLYEPTNLTALREAVGRNFNGGR